MNKEWCCFSDGDWEEDEEAEGWLHQCKGTLLSFDSKASRDTVAFSFHSAEMVTQSLNNPFVNQISPPLSPALSLFSLSLSLSFPCV